MKIYITSFVDAGNYQNERIVMKAVSDLDLGQYAVFYTAVSSDGGVTAGRKTAFWFPDGEIKKDDLVVLYSKKGKSSTKDLGEGRTARFFYWQDERAMWGGAENGAVLLRVAEWSKKVPPEAG
ncbi:hypothetical protein [Metallibacterium scheffleri]|uniref:Uncharacterized protein n=1 Tax=Metallibacterium scheffleri TaxID=993689 RepID=A0A4V3UT50_9GAMM|nr:hypothetical protein [Metallibacterium scheffleri]THD09311.1 hypothetical protein B1806_11305 [Metallibacterium scheffleri]